MLTLLTQLCVHRHAAQLRDRPDAQLAWLKALRFELDHFRVMMFSVKPFLFVATALFVSLFLYDILMASGVRVAIVYPAILTGWGGVHSCSQLFAGLEVWGNRCG